MTTSQLQTFVVMRKTSEDSQILRLLEIPFSPAVRKAVDVHWISILAGQLSVACCLCGLRISSSTWLSLLLMTLLNVDDWFSTRGGLVLEWMDTQWSGNLSSCHSWWLGVAAGL